MDYLDQTKVYAELVTLRELLIEHGLTTEEEFRRMYWINHAAIEQWEARQQDPEVIRECGDES